LVQNKLETVLQLKLHAVTETESGLEGSITILHVQNAHKISIEIYETTTGRLRRPVTIPTRPQMQAILNTL